VKVAYYSPLPPSRSGIADYSALLLPALRERVEVVHDRETGIVVAPEAVEIARACAYLVTHVDEAKAWGRAGLAIAERVTWDTCVDALLS
jgi:glycosyltransferase involved in cell wall biosynthesis